MFSERELKVIKAVGKKKSTLQDIANEVFKDEYKFPFDAAISVGNTIRRIIKKCEYHGEDWTFAKERNDGKMLIYRRKV